MPNPHAEWFTALDGNAHWVASPNEDAAPAMYVRISSVGYFVALNIEGPFPTERAAVIAAERRGREIADLIASAPDAIDAARDSGDRYRDDTEQLHYGKD